MSHITAASTTDTDRQNILTNTNRHMAEASTVGVENAAGNTGSNDKEPEKESPAKEQFECNICLDEAKDAVISLCGHLFCWPCLLQWLETRPRRQECPVCKAGIDRDKVIPLYGRGSTTREDPRDKIPKRPQAQRPEPENRNGFNAFNFGDGGFQMSFGIGAFPFGFFGTFFNLNDGRPGPLAPDNPHYQDEQILSKVFLGVAILLMSWLLFA